MYEKLVKCAAKTGFQIQSCIPRAHEMKNRILSKNKGCLFIPSSKNISTAQLHDVCSKNTFSPEFGAPFPPVSYAYAGSLSLLHEFINSERITG